MSPKFRLLISTKLTRTFLVFILLSVASRSPLAADIPSAQTGTPTTPQAVSGAAAAPGLAAEQSALPSPAPATAAILGLDTKTEGAWVGHYGSEGYNLANQVAELPGYAQLTVSTLPDTAISSTGDPRVLKIPGKSTGPWTNWATLSSFSIALNLADKLPHKVSLYALDYYNGGWRQRITIKDANSGAVLSIQNLSSYAGGVYITWQVSGHVIFDITSTADQGCCGVVSGIFFDPPQPLTRPAHVIVSAKSTAIAMGITAPSEPNYLASQFSIKVSALPSGGTVTLADALTPVTLGQRLTPGQMTGLKFVPGPVAATTASNFAYISHRSGGSKCGGKRRDRGRTGCRRRATASDLLQPRNGNNNQYRKRSG